MPNSTQSESKFQYYRYDPSLAAAVLFTVIFALLGIAHVYRVAKGKIWYFLVFTFGIALQFGGYIGRIANSQQAPNFDMAAYIIQSLFLLVSPAFFAASIYMTLGRLIRTARAEHLSPIRTNLLTKVFVSGDVLSFMTQAAGGGLMASSGNMDIGQWVVVGGLSIQIFYFTIFVLVAAIFHSRVEKTRLLNRELWLQLSILYFASILILVRSVFRVVEFGQGNAGYLISHEAFLYVFDALLMSIVVAVYVACPPLFYSATGESRVEKIPMRHSESARSDVESFSEAR